MRDALPHGRIVRHATPSNGKLRQSAEVVVCHLTTGSGLSYRGGASTERMLYQGGNRMNILTGAGKVMHADANAFRTAPTNGGATGATPGLAALWTLWLAGTALLACSCATANVPPNPQAQARLETMKSVAVLTPDVRLVRRSIGGSEEQLRDMDIQASGQLTTLVAAEFSQRGFQTRESPAARTVTTEVQSAHDQIKYEQRFELEHPTLLASGNMATPAAAIAKQTGADGLVFVKLEGYRRSGGSIAGEVATKTLIGAATMGMVVPLKDPNAAAVLAVTLVDSKAGGVLWCNEASDVWGLTLPDFGESDLAEMVTKVFEHFPPTGMNGPQTQDQPAASY